MTKKLLFLLVLLLTATTGAWAAEVTVTKTVYNLFPDVDDGTQKATLYSDANLSISVNPDGNNGKVYGKGTEWRLYQTNSAVVTVTATEATIKTVAFTFAVKNTGVIKYDGNAMTSGTAVNVNAASAQFVVGNSGAANNGQVIISGFTVVYETTGGGSGDVTYSVTFAEGTDPNEWNATPNTGLKQGETVTVTYSGSKKVIGVKAEKKAAAAAKTLAEATSEDIGKIAGKDGKIYATKADAEAVATGNAVAMIAYVGSATEHGTYTHGLAIALANANEGEMNWSTAKSSCEGKTAVTGAAWLLPSQSQWKTMFSANGGKEDDYTGLQTAANNAGGVGTLQQGTTFWTSTESGDNAYSVGLHGMEPKANFYSDPKTNYYYARPVLAF